MHLFQQALAAGWRSALQLRVLVPPYICNVLIGLIQVWPLLAAGDHALHNPFLHDLAGGGSDALVNLFLNNTAVVGPAVGWVFLVPLLTLLNGLAYVFCAGGIISSYAHKRSFWRGCRYFFWSFCGLSVILLLLAGVFAGLAALIGRLGGMTWGLISLGVSVGSLNLVGEYARALAVVHDRRNPFVLFGMACTFCARHLIGVLLLALLGIALHLAVAAGYSPVAKLIGAVPPVVIWQQIVVFVWLWIKGLRLAWATQYVIAQDQQTHPLPITPDPMPAPAAHV